MTYLNELENRRIGTTRNRKSVYPTVAVTLLESLRCHSTDEYLVYGAEDETPVPPLACSFSRVPNSAHLLALVDENGSLVIYDTNKYGEKALLKDWNAHSNAVFDLAWMSKEEKILTGSGDQTICLWDATTAQKLLTFKGHTSSVRSVVFSPWNDAVFASGSRDGHVRLWDHRCNIKDDQVSSINVIRNAHAVPQQPGLKKRKSRICSAQPLDSQQSVTSVVFQDDNLLATAGAVDGRWLEAPRLACSFAGCVVQCLVDMNVTSAILTCVIKVWDLRKVKSTTTEPTALYNFPYTGTSKRTHGYSSLVFDSSFSRLFASCTDDIIYMYDFASYNTTPVCSFRGHRNTSFYVKAVVSPDDQFLLSGSSDEHAYVWQISNPNQSPVVLKGHRSEVSDVAWCQKDLFRIVTASDDNMMRIWRFDPTAVMRKAGGQSDISCGITGTAERTHRDIGTDVFPHGNQNRGSVPSSPVPGQKRASSELLQPNITPKRAKTLPASSSATISPSIKNWLKRGVSEEMTSCEQTRNKVLKLTESEQTISVTNKEENSGETAVKVTEKGDATTVQLSRPQEVHNKSIVGKPSCKRKLEESSGERPSKKINVNKSPLKENIETKENQRSQEKANSVLDSSVNQTKESNFKDSSNKQSTPLKDLKSDINTSPDKRVQDGKLEFYSPARLHKLDIDAKTLSSPTTNLPNSVLDSPLNSKKVLNSQSNTKVKKSKVDWLTELRLQKKGRQSNANKSCSRKLSDKYGQSSDLASQSKESQPFQGSSEDLLKCKSPAAGIKSITSFFKRQTST